MPKSYLRQKRVTLMKTIFSALLLLLLISELALATFYPSSMCYVAQWNNGLNTEQIYPIKKKKSNGAYYTAKEYYSYDKPKGSSANTPDGLEESSVAQYFFFDDDQETSLFFIFDKFEDGSGGIVKATITSVGLAGKGAQITVRDDPGDNSYVWNDATGTASPSWQWWPCCTDGMVLGKLPRPPTTNNFSPVDYSYCVNFKFDTKTLQGVDQFKVRSLNKYYEDGGNKFKSVSISYSLVNTLNLCYVQCSCLHQTFTTLKGQFNNHEVTFGAGGNIGNYRANSNCTWNIDLPSDVAGISFFWIDFQVASGQPDKLDIYDASGAKQRTYPSGVTDWKNNIDANMNTEFQLSSYNHFTLTGSKALFHFSSGPNSPGGRGFDVVYYAIPTLTSLNPSTVGMPGGDTITIKGKHFINNPNLRCRFINKSNGPTVKATFVSSTEIRCKVPAYVEPEQTTQNVWVSNDGFEYSGPLSYNYDANCDKITNCISCTADPKCGWCNDPLQPGEGVCMQVSNIQNPVKPAQCTGTWDYSCCSVCGSHNCSGHGICNCNQTCTCDLGYKSKDDCSCFCPEDETGLICSGHGSCDCAGNCECDYPWRGPSCDCLVCEGNPSFCWGHGECQCNGTCICEEGYDPETNCFCPLDCSAFNHCNGHGTCSCGTCICDAGWDLRPDCSCADGSVCPTAVLGDECSGHGYCTCDGTCECDEGWEGEDCNQPVACNGTTCEECNQNGAKQFCQWCPLAGTCENVYAPAACTADESLANENATNILIPGDKCPPPEVIYNPPPDAIRQEEDPTTMNVAIAVGAAAAAFVLVGAGIGLYRRMRYEKGLLDETDFDDNDVGTINNPVYEQNPNQGVNPLYAKDDGL